MIDTQSVRVAVNVLAATTGRDAAKKVPGRKRGPAMDVMGLVIAVSVPTVSAHDRQRVRTPLLERIDERELAVAAEQLRAQIDELTASLRGNTLYDPRDDHQIGDLPRPPHRQPCTSSLGGVFEGRYVLSSSNIFR